MINHTEADGAGNFGDALTDAAETKDAERELIHLPCSLDLCAEAVPDIVINGLGKDSARPQSIGEQAHDILDDGLGVGIRRVNDGDAATLAGVDVDVVEPDAGPTDDSKSGPLRQHFVSHNGVGSNDERFCAGEKLGETRVVGGTESNFCAGGQPANRLGIERFSLNDQRLG